ncbi:L-ribulokinase [Mariniphaga anaerophila]|uniref:L-ribulokinase n=1 Tax=Mariniphaga anaerophila TaxID=1484053 RepID=A0A1M4V784_9BACT|nr:ribulokinase [Mariniphaga anaerophila]SHE64846.1 L-ribulokinase [Mariniphaga anaerophila]
MKGVIGADFGSDSCRVILVDAHSGTICATATRFYPRWMEGKYCDSEKNRYRQHPSDYVEAFEGAVKEMLQNATREQKDSIAGIAFATTSSTVCLTDVNGIPLALLPEFRENPDAMFALWKDHTAVKEAEEINELVHQWPVDYNKYIGGRYSSEWVWSKVLHLLRNDKEVAAQAFSWIEQCDWLPNLLCGINNPEKRKYSRCAGGHKAMWHQEWGGLPSSEFMQKLAPDFPGFLFCPYRETYTADTAIGTLTEEWASKLGLPANVKVAVGSVDCHVGAVGAQIKPGFMVSVVGTSTCDILVAEKEKTGASVVPGICGQVDGSVLPGLIGFEAGQPAFGDLYAWFKELLVGPLEQLLPHSGWLDENSRERLLNEIREQMIPWLTAEAEKLPVDSNAVLATDWINGRRSPDADELVKATITGLHLGSNAPGVFKALVDASVYGLKAIVDRYSENGMEVNEVIGAGGIAQKSSFVMQTMADVLGLPVKITNAKESCALGAAMFASVATGVYRSVEEAQEAMGQGFSKVYYPRNEFAAIHQKRYQEYLKYKK